MSLITDTQALSALCSAISRAPYVAVDTEFMRERTYWPKLCLVQIAGGGREGPGSEVGGIDALAPGIDLSPLFRLLADEKVLKVFHAARQDLEIFHHLTGALPHPVFDTQVAAMVCGFGDSVSYENLVANLTKSRIDKSSRFTDWALRPLSERQIAYAISDVVHLREVYEKLQRKLHANGRELWIEEEMAVLIDPAIYLADPGQAYRRIKARSSNPRFLAVLRELAAWRETEARRRDLPRSRVVRDEALVEIAHHQPRAVDELARTRGFSRKLADGRDGEALLKAVARGMAVPESEAPEPETRAELPRGVESLAELLKVLLKMRCEEFDVAQKLVASSADLEEIAALGDRASMPALHGWRRELFGNDALRLRCGEIALAVTGKRVGVVAVPQATVFERDDTNPA